MLVSMEFLMACACMPTPVPAPLRRTNNEDDDAQRILAQYTHTMTSAPFLEKVRQF